MRFGETEIIILEPFGTEKEAPFVSAFVERGHGVVGASFEVRRATHAHGSCGGKVDRPTMSPGAVRLH